MFAIDRNHDIRNFCSAILIVGTILLSTISSARADEPGEPKAESSEGILVEHGDAAEFGVFITDSPGQGVLVVSVVSGSSAEAVGIRAGDFITAIDTNPIDLPESLSAAIESKPAGSTVKVDIWRDGKLETKSIQLVASAAIASRKGHAWLGVRLSSSQDADGATIERVVPDGPAAKADLRVGDVLIGFDDAPTNSVPDLIGAIKSHRASDKVKLKIRRGDKKIEVEVQLGAMDDAPIFSFRKPLDGIPFDVFPIPEVPEIRIVPQAIDHSALEAREAVQWRHEIEQLRDELEQMRKQLRELTGDRKRDADISQ